MTSLVVRYRETEGRWVAWLVHHGDWSKAECCKQGHQSLLEAARHGADILVEDAVAAWTEAAKNPNSYAAQVLGAVS